MGSGCLLYKSYIILFVYTCLLHVNSPHFLPQLGMYTYICKVLNCNGKVFSNLHNLTENFYPIALEITVVREPGRPYNHNYGI